MGSKFQYGVLSVVVILLMVTLGFYKYGRSYWHPYHSKVAGKRTVSQVDNLYRGAAFSRLKPAFRLAGVMFPPKELTLLAFKDTNNLELWARDSVEWKRVKEYRILAASGVLGPKLREGDRQVPEGVYQIEGLNPNSAYHLSMKLNYPNAFDLRWAKKEGRSSPGTNIFIHGKAVSIGCLAIGDTAIEELFMLVNTVGRNNVDVIISPSDPREKSLQNSNTSKPWIDSLYQDITAAVFNVSKVNK